MRSRAPFLQTSLRRACAAPAFPSGIKWRGCWPVRPPRSSPRTSFAGPGEPRGPLPRISPRAAWSVSWLYGPPFAGKALPRILSSPVVDSRQSCLTGDERFERIKRVARNQTHDPYPCIAGGIQLIGHLLPMRQAPRVCGGGTPEIENFDPETATLTASRQQQKATRAYELPDVSQESYSLVDGKIIDVVEQRRYVEQLLGPSLPDIGRLDST